MNAVDEDAFYFLPAAPSRAARDPPPPPHGHHLGQLSEYSPLNTSRKKFEGIIAKILDVLRRVQKP
jgi:hypothetical protein